MLEVVLIQIACKDGEIVVNKLAKSENVGENNELMNNLSVVVINQGIELEVV